MKLYRRLRPSRFAHSTGEVNSLWWSQRLFSRLSVEHILGPPTVLHAVRFRHVSPLAGTDKDLAEALRSSGDQPGASAGFFCCVRVSSEVPCFADSDGEEPTTVPVSSVEQPPPEIAPAWLEESAGPPLQWPRRRPRHVRNHQTADAAIKSFTHLCRDCKPAQGREQAAQQVEQERWRSQGGSASSAWPQWLEMELDSTARSPHGLLALQCSSDPRFPCIGVEAPLATWVMATLSSNYVFRLLQSMPEAEKSKLVLPFLGQPL